MEFLAAGDSIVDGAPGVFISRLECSAAGLVLPACNPHHDGEEILLLPFLIDVEGNQ